MKLSDMAVALGGTLHGQDAVFSGVSTDSRTLAPGQVFIALQGENFDGHGFVAQASDRGIAGAVVSRVVDASVAQILVSDTRLALGRWAAVWASQFDIPRIAVTGSCGKTSVKEMIASILSQRGRVLATEGNLNNDIGAPLTLLRMNETHGSAVIELGANHAGEIDYTSALVAPDVALITNVGDAHLEGFGSREKIAQAKAEIFSGLKSGGVAVINADDAFAGYWRTLNAGRRQFSFSLHDRTADVFLVSMKLDAIGRARFTASLAGTEVSVKLGVIGQHQVNNALAAIAATYVLGVSANDIVAGLESLQPIKGRMYPRELGAWHWIEDSYNANPTSMRAALDFLRDVAEPKVAVLGGMGELGDNAANLHREIGEYAAHSGLSRLLVVGPRGAEYAEGFERANTNGKVFQVATHADAGHWLIKHMPAGQVLVKGSRSARMEQVFDEAAAVLNKGD